MNKRTLNAIGEHRSALKYLREFMKQKYDGVFELRFDEEYNVGASGTKTEPNGVFPKIGRIGTKGLHLDSKFESFYKDISDMDFTSIVVASFHECRHALIIEAMEDENFSQNYSDMEYMVATQLAILDNPCYNISNWSNFMTEVDAERFGVKCAGEFLSELYGDSKAEHMILDYINYKVPGKGLAEKNLPGDGYVIPYTGNKHYQYSDLSVVYSDFDACYERAKHAHRQYWNEKNGVPSDIESDKATEFFSGKTAERVWRGFAKEQDGALQDNMVAAITLENNPKYRQHIVDKYIVNLRPEVVFGPNWDDMTEPYVEPKEPKKVTAGELAIEKRKAEIDAVIGKNQFKTVKRPSVNNAVLNTVSQQIESDDQYGYE